MALEPTNNPDNITPKRYGTLPLEPRVSREEKESNAAYMPQPPRPKDFDEVEKKIKSQPTVNPNVAPVVKPVAQPTVNPALTPTNEDNRKTTNFLNQDLPRQYGPSDNYARPRNEAAIPPKARNEAAIPPKARGIANKPISTAERMTQPPVNAPQPRPTIISEPQGPKTAPMGAPVNRERTAPMGAPVNREQTAPMTPPPPAPRHGMPQRSGSDYYPAMAQNNLSASSGKGKIIGIVAGVVLLLGIGGFIFYLKGGDESTKTEATAQTVATTDANEATNAPESAQPQGATDTDTPGVGSSAQEVSLFNRPLTYAGTVSPGGAASLNIILYQNGRIEGTLDYSNGQSMPVYGSYTWTDNGHKMNVNFTVSSNSDKSYSESWMGSSSYIKDDLAHTLTFSRINTSNGQSMTASFALKP